MFLSYVIFDIWFCFVASVGGTLVCISLRLFPLGNSTFTGSSPQYVWLSVSCDIRVNEAYLASPLQFALLGIKLALVSAHNLFMKKLRIRCTIKDSHEASDPTDEGCQVDCGSYIYRATDQKYNWLTPCEHLSTGAVNNRIVTWWDSETLFKVLSRNRKTLTWLIRNSFVKQINKLAATSIHYSYGWKGGMLMDLSHINNCSI